MEDKGDETTTGYRNFSDLELLQNLTSMRERIVKLTDPLDTIETDKNIEEFGASPISAEEMKKTEVQVLKDQIENLEEEMNRRQSLN